MLGRFGWRILGLVVLVGLLGACDSAQAPGNPNSGTSVGAIFKEFYQRLGGEALVGPCLTQAFERDGLTYQYTSAVLMVYDPNAPTPKRYSLASLGNEFGVKEPPGGQATRTKIGDYWAWEEILPIYERLGVEITGYPLTNVRYNAELHRYEQYFEKMGFYRYETDPQNNVHLLAYGAKTCGTYCTYLSVRDAVPEHNSLPMPSAADLQSAEMTISQMAARLGTQVTGRAITPAFKGSSGQIEQVFENLVFTVSPDDTRRASVRSLQDALGMRPDPLETQDPNDYFYEKENGLGYNISSYFMDYITFHGGVEVSGTPISREYNVNDRITRQCYTNLCLEFHRTAPETLRIRPQAIGYIYRDLNYRPVAEDVAPISYQATSLKIWEDDPLISQKRQQVVRAAVYDNNVPVKGVELRLSLTLPDGTQNTYTMPLTNDEGQSSIALPLISGPNGTLVPYKVCVTSAASDKLCDQQSFILWESP
jgi:choline dehydrogenase-like flavoprotein